MSQNPGIQPVGQVSADGQFRWDGQQWVALPPGFREPTPWTRPMQLAAAALFVIDALSGLVLTLAFVNHDTMVRALKAQGTAIPAGTDINTVVNFAVAAAIGIVVFVAVLSLIAAAGSFLGWRWMFWAALALFALGGIGALTNLGTLSNSGTSPIPFAGVLFNEIGSLASLGMFIWMLVGVIKFGPWAMRRPGV